MFPSFTPELLLALAAAVCAVGVLYMSELEDGVFAAQVLGAIAVLALVLLGVGVVCPSLWDSFQALPLACIPAGMAVALVLQRWS